MPYRATFGPLFRPASSIIGAIPFAAFGASVVGTGLCAASFLLVFLFQAVFDEGYITEPHYWPLALIVFAVALAAMLIIATFMVAFYLLIFGMPVAALMRERLAGNAGMVITAGVAIIAAAAVTHILIGPLEYGAWAEDSGQWLGVAIILAYAALPSAILYRKAVIGLLDEPI